MEDLQKVLEQLENGKRVVAAKGANLRHAWLQGANLREADLGRADLWEANLREADLGRANLREANLGRADLGRADLREADLGEADLGRADLRKADLRGAYLGRADLGRADLREANLEGVNLVGVNLESATLENAKGIVSFPNLGSRNDTLYVVLRETQYWFKTGCFWGPKSQFIEAVKIKHGDNKYAQDYLEVLEKTEAQMRY